MGEIVEPSFDAWWKDLLDGFLEELLSLLAPEVHAAIDWRRGFESLDEEFRALFPEGRKGARHVDKLIGVTLETGEPLEILLHVEVHVDRDRALPWRLFEYRFLIRRKRRRPVATLAILADRSPGYRSDDYEEEVVGTRVRLDFHAVNLLDLEDRADALVRSGGAAGILVASWLRSRSSRSSARRREWKRGAYRILDALREAIEGRAGATS